MNNESLNGVKEQRDSIEGLTYQLLRHIGENPEREGLIKTPERVERAWKSLTEGYKEDPKQILKSALFQESSDQMVVVKDIDVFSLCEHHLLPFFGVVHVAYIPNGQVVGLSKIPRLVEAFAKRLQLQERLSSSIGTCLLETLGAKGVAVYMECRHMCMIMRGVKKVNAVTTTTFFKGVFEEEQRKEEFYRSISINTVK